MIKRMNKKGMPMVTTLVWVVLGLALVAGVLIVLFDIGGIWSSFVGQGLDDLPLTVTTCNGLSSGGSLFSPAFCDQFRKVGEKSGDDVLMTCDYIHKEGISVLTSAESFECGYDYDEPTSQQVSNAKVKCDSLEKPKVILNGKTCGDWKTEAAESSCLGEGDACEIRSGTFCCEGLGCSDSEGVCVVLEAEED